MTTRKAWLTAIVLALALVLGMGAATLAADVVAPGNEPERYEKTWCKEPGEPLSACAVQVTP